MAASWIGTGGSSPGDVRTDGKIGVGTDPAQAIHVYSTSSYPMAAVVSNQTGGGDLLLASSSGQWEMYAEGSNLRFFDSSADRVTFKNGGKVGIGTTNPTNARLVVHQEDNVGIIVEHAGLAGIGFRDTIHSDILNCA